MLRVLNILTSARMNHDDHITRTLWVSRKYPNWLVVSSGSNANIDTASYSPNIGRAIVKVFDLTTTSNVNYAYVVFFIPLLPYLMFFTTDLVERFLVTA